MQKRQQYISRSARAGEDIKDLRNILDSSLANVARDPDLGPILMDHEIKKLDDSVDYHSRSMAPTR